MVYRFKIVSEEADNFYRIIDINSEANFLELRNAILDSVGYARDGMDSFFICDEDWNRHEQIAIEDFGSASDEDIWIMEETCISELVEDEGQHLAFVFDNIGERAFFMALVSIDYNRSLSIPECSMSKGNPPVRILPLNEIDSRAEKKTAAQQDFDIDNMYGEDSYNEDELEGFDSLDF